MFHSQHPAALLHATTLGRCEGRVYVFAASRTLQTNLATCLDIHSPGMLQGHVPQPTPRRAAARHRARRVWRRHLCVGQARPARFRAAQAHRAAGWQRTPLPAPRAPHAGLPVCGPAARWQEPAQGLERQPGGRRGGRLQLAGRGGGCRTGCFAPGCLHGAYLSPSLCIPLQSLCHVCPSAALHHTCFGKLCALCRSCWLCTPAPTFKCQWCCA